MMHDIYIDKSYQCSSPMCVAMGGPPGPSFGIHVTSRKAQDLLGKTCHAGYSKILLRFWLHNLPALLITSSKYSEMAETDGTEKTSPEFLQYIRERDQAKEQIKVKEAELNQARCRNYELLQEVEKLRDQVILLFIVIIILLLFR